jgi:hypothetical protein
MRTTTVYFFTLDRLLLLYMSQVRTKLEYAPVIQNSLPDTDSTKLEHVQESFVPYVTIESLKIIVLIVIVMFWITQNWMLYL